MVSIGKLRNFIYKIATGNSRKKILLTPIFALIYFGFAAACVLGCFMLDKWMDFRDILNKPWNEILGVFLIVIGFFIMAYSVLYFVRVKGTPVPLNPPPKLVDTGPYAVARNPMLTGVFIQLLGLGFLFNSISLLCIFLPFFILVNVMELKSIEEPELERRLGSQYLQYKKRVPMFFPRIRNIKN